MADKLLEGEHLMYRGRPLLREGNTLSYGSMLDKYILFMIILSNKTVKAGDPPVESEIPDKILVQILSTDTSKPPYERVVKQFDKNGLQEAMDIGLIWLDKLNNNEE